MQIAQIYCVLINDADGSDASGSKIKGRGRPEAASANTEHPRLL
jgi:hypothetical protein